MAEDRNADAAGALTRLHAVLLDADSLEEFLDELVHAAARVLPVAVSCGVTLGSPDHPYTAAASDQLVADFDAEQYAMGEGPCTDALRTGKAVRIGDTCTDTRYGPFRARACARSLRSVLGLPLAVAGQKPVGVMNLYAVPAHAFTPEVRAQAEGFAAQAAGATALALRISEHVRRVRDLEAALASRSVIDQALGIVAAQRRCTPEEAFRLLSRASQDRNTKLRDLAAQIVASVGTPPRG